MRKKASGGVQSFVSLTFLRNLIIPPPPLEEQKRIVCKIEEMLKLTNKMKNSLNIN
jgi:type I restriction enzyme S subunit